MFLFVRFFRTELLPTLRTECLTLALYSFLYFRIPFFEGVVEKNKNEFQKKSPPLITLFFSLAPFLPLLLLYFLSAASRLFLLLLIAPVLQTRVQQGVLRVPRAQEKGAACYRPKKGSACYKPRRRQKSMKAWPRRWRREKRNKIKNQLLQKEKNKPPQR